MGVGIKSCIKELNNGNVLKFFFDGIFWMISALTSSAAVELVQCKMLFEIGLNQVPMARISVGSVNQDEGGTASCTVTGKYGSIF